MIGHNNLVEHLPEKGTTIKMAPTKIKHKQKTCAGGFMFSMQGQSIKILCYLNQIVSSKNTQETKEPMQNFLITMRHVTHIQRLSNRLPRDDSSTIGDSHIQSLNLVCPEAKTRASGYQFLLVSKTKQLFDALVMTIMVKVTKNIVATITYS